MAATQLLTLQATDESVRDSIDFRASNADALFTRLSDCGIDTAQIKRIPGGIPQATLFFQRQFPERSIDQVLEGLDQWRALLQRNFLLSLEERNHSPCSVDVSFSALQFCESLSSVRWCEGFSIKSRMVSERSCPSQVKEGLRSQCGRCKINLAGRWRSCSSANTLTTLRSIQARYTTSSILGSRA
jgi:hypothetical protein